MPMCNPALAQLGAQSLEAGGSYFIQSENSRRQLRAQESNARRVQQDEAESVTRQNNALMRMDAEQTRRAYAEILEARRAAGRARGALKSDAGAAGVEGASVDDAINDFTRQEMMRVELISRRREAERDQIEDQQFQIDRQAEARIRAAAGGPVQQPNLFGALIQIAGAGIDYAGSQGEFDPESGNWRWFGGDS